jgi:hypothetical protein
LKHPELIIKNKKITRGREIYYPIGFTGRRDFQN